MSSMNLWEASFSLFFYRSTSFVNLSSEKSILVESPLVLFSYLMEQRMKCFRKVILSSGGFEEID